MTLASGALLFVVGIVAGTLNVVAGGGSFLTLPTLIFLGLPPGVANGTNRIGIFMQNAGAVWGFHRHRVLDWKLGAWAAIPATMGAALGTLIAVRIEDDAFQRILAGLMVGITVISLWDPIGRRRATRGAPPAAPNRAWMALGFFGVGIYGGFVQAGVGFFILAATTLAGLDMVRGNAVKVLAILCFTVMALGIFSVQGLVLLWPGLILGIGTTIGGQIGVRLTVLKGHRWVKRVVSIMVVLFAIRLWWTA